jgi:phosphoribosylamine---glycine ligase
MKILVIGAGAREHALVWALRRSPLVERLYCAPGNPGIAEIARIVPLQAGETQALLDFVLAEEIDLTIVGPEQPLADGLVDMFEGSGVAVFGPTRKAAELEWSKAFAKAFMTRHAIPTASYQVFTAAEAAAARDFAAHCPLPVVLKADGLAAGKGVVICVSREEALRTLELMLFGTVFGKAGARVVIEECLEGEEASVFAICDGTEYIVLAPAQDHKRVFDGDRGKNTGGMGAYAPAPVMTPALLEEVERTVIRPTLEGMAAERRPYRGCLYVGLMVTASGPKVIEYNARFGDPETQVVLPLFGGDLAATIEAATRGGLAAIRGSVQGCVPGASAVCVVLASGGYPETFATGKEISGLDALAGREGIIVFHAGTRRDGDRLVTAGGRVLGVTAVSHSGSLREAVHHAYDAISSVTFDGMHYRRDIAHRALSRLPAETPLQDP